MEKIGKILFSRTTGFVLAIAFQVIFLVGCIEWLAHYFMWARIGFRVLSGFVVFVVVNRKQDPAYQLAWCVLILFFPILGGLFYLFFGARKIPDELQCTDRNAVNKALEVITIQKEVITALKKESESAFFQFQYVYRNAHFPVFQHTKTVYFKSGEEMLEVMQEQLKLAKKTIFMEYFILEEGKMWDSILKILESKVKEGVDVRVIYDDAGCLATLKKGYDKILKSKGIQCEIFNPMKARLWIRMNYRDHRKITIIDNNVAFTGGINLADEYINQKERVGYWKDTAMMFIGDAVFSFTLLFAQMWNYLSDSPLMEYDFLEHTEPKDGYVQPFGDSPTDKENIGMALHQKMIHLAKRTVMIATPYLIISHEMKQTLCMAAKSGVEVKIVVPHVPDRWVVHMMTRGNYKTLIESGVHIYEYIPGFLHSKMMLVDDEIALCGTINMDYRSYYLHYENAVLLYKCSSLRAMREDFDAMIENSQRIDENDCNNIPFVVRVFHAILNLFSPLM